MKYAAVIPAAGSGRRMKSKVDKQFIKLDNYPIMVHTLKIFSELSVFSELILVVKENKIKFCQQSILKKYGIEGVKLVAGGKSRRQSVLKGLRALSDEIDFVVIHDAARPLLPIYVLRNLIKEVTRYKAVTTAINVKDTIKLKRNEDFIERTLNRDKLIIAQTPQAFKLDLILKAHRDIADDDRVSDDASLAELAGYPVKMVEGSYENIKITTKSDLIFAKLILDKRRDSFEGGNRI